MKKITIKNYLSKFENAIILIDENESKIKVEYKEIEKSMKIKIEYGYIYKLLKTMIKTEDPERLYKYLVDCYNNDFCVCLADKVLNHVLENGK